MLEILVEFDRYCKQHDLTYFLGYGTLLGAIRHNGFIPWDNDIDVVMLRDDYNKLRQLLVIEPISANLHALDYRFEKTFPFLKITDVRTVVREKYLETENNLGLYIDVFPLDIIPDDPKLIKKIQKKCFLLYKLYAFTSYRFGTGKNLVKKMFKFLLFPLRLFVNQQRVCKMLDFFYTTLPVNCSSKLINLVWGLPDDRDVYDITWYHDVISVSFEGYNFNAPNQYDLILKQQYGDYLKLPPVSERFTHDYNAIWK